MYDVPVYTLHHDQVCVYMVPEAHGHTLCSNQTKWNRFMRKLFTFLTKLDEL